MKLRDLKYVTETPELKKLITKFQMHYVLIDDHIVLWNNHIILDIYGYTIETNIYFDFYSKDLEFYTNTNGIIEEKDFGKIRDEYEIEKMNRTDVVSSDKSVNRSVLLKAEVNLFFYLKAFTKYSCHYFEGEKKISESSHSRKTEPYQKKTIESYDII